MRLLYGHDRAVEQFVSERIKGCENGFGACRTAGVIDQAGNLVAGWIWHNWDPAAQTIEFSGAALGPGWITRSILNKLFGYAFEGIDCQMIITRNRADNTSLHRQLETIGFSRFDIPRLFGRETDGVAWALTDDDWKESKFYGKA